MSLRGAGVALAALATLALAVPASAAADQLNAYQVKAKSAKQLLELKRQGFDITEGHRRGGLEIVATREQINRLSKAGLRAKLLRNRRGQTARRAAAAQAAGGWQVWRPYARTDVELSGAAGNPTKNIVTQLRELADRYDRITELVTLGRSLNGQPIYAMRVTRNADNVPDGRRPAVLYSALQHAREWLAGETNLRTLKLFVTNFGQNGPAIGTDGQPVEGVSAQEVTRLLSRNEAWFIPVANPDGYDFTFDPENRLWRKNLRDVDGNGEITSVDGVDPNRNFPTRWNYDDEGSNTDTSSETYRGTGPASEPETRAFLRLTRRVHFTSNKNDHTHGRLLLWPPGWQVDTRFADEPIFTTLAGDDDNPAIPTFDPDVGAELYTTNGDTNDHLYQEDRVQSFTPEGTPAASGSGFVFQDVEADVQAEFERHIQFSLDLLRSAATPTRPVSHLGNEAPDFVLDRFNVSFGDPQTVQVNARRDIGRITLKYRINGGRERSRSTSEWRGGERYGDEGDYWYHRMRGQVRGTDPGDEVEVWFVAENERSGPRDDIESRPFTYDVRSDSNARVLVLAQEDYTGNSALPAYEFTDRPNYLDYYTDALEANGVEADVWDYDAENPKAPDPLGVLSHYDAVVWYTGNDNITRPIARPGVAELAAHETTMAVRDFLNEGGRLMFSGVNAGRQYDLVEYPPAGEPLTFCDGDLLTEECQPLSNDFLQYYLGSYVRSDAGGLDSDPNGSGVFDVGGLAGGPFDGLTLGLNGPDSAGNQGGDGLGTSNHLVTSSVLDPETYPQFASDDAADWVLPGGAPFEPQSGTHYMYSQNANEGYKRLTRTIDVPAGGSADLSFSTSYNTELGWDFVFVEAHTVGQDNWTTLPDANGHTTQEVGSSCPSGWTEELHNHLRHYQTYNPAGGGSCTPTGTTGAWHAATGNSGGWQDWRVDLSQFAGQQVEVSIVFATDWGTLAVPGALVDDTVVTANGSTVAQTDFETDLGGWSVPGAHPAGPSTNVNDWIQSERIPFEDASITQTDDTLYFGFGLEGVNGAGTRAGVMGRALDYLLR
jgi:Zinc carboxypeptidase/Immune inhibitor A peptidase M6